MYMRGGKEKSRWGMAADREQVQNVKEKVKL
jgi:hypothetical protein